MRELKLFVVRVIDGEATFVYYPTSHTATPADLVNLGRVFEPRRQTWAKR